MVAGALFFGGEKGKMNWGLGLRERALFRGYYFGEIIGPRPRRADEKFHQFFFVPKRDATALTGSLFSGVKPQLAALLRFFTVSVKST